MEKIISYIVKSIPNSLTALIFKQRKSCVFLINLGTILCSLLISLALRFEFSIPTIYIENFIRIAAVFVLVKMILSYIFKLNKGLWRYFSLTDIKDIFKANLFSASILVLIFHYFRIYICESFPMSVLVIDCLVCFCAMSFIRGTIRVIREINDKTEKCTLIRTIVVGKMEDVDTFLHGINVCKTRREITAVFCFEKNIGSTLRGIKIERINSKIGSYAKKHAIKEIILLPPYSRKRFLKLLLANLEKIEYVCSLKIIQNIEGEIDYSNVRKVNIDDLLGRPPVKFDHSEVAELIVDKNIMVTGGGGSIGSELCSQICQYHPKKLLIFEASEYNLYEIERKLKLKFPKQKIEAVLGDIRYKDSVAKAIENHSIEVIFHAAAYKHVPLLEKNILAGVQTNIIGTSNVADCAEEHGVKRVVIISTDKAVRPTSIMGATKRIAERIVLEREYKGTKFIAVRFGNVLGSRGSVIPLFREQIKAGGPVTVTSKNMIRYFMSIPEAAELVLQAGTIGNDRDIMILEMGEQVNIYEMAKRLIELSGFIPHRDIKIEFTGIRSGEKEYEELITKEEHVNRTPFERIFVSKKIDTEKNHTNVSVTEISAIVESENHNRFRDLCKQYIPDNLLQ